MKLLFIILFVGIIFAQQQVGRSVSPNSLTQNYDSTSTLFPISAFWAEFQKGFGSKDDAMNSNIRFGGLFSFYRLENSSLDFNLAFELTADPNNEISFNPRSARWQEELFINTKNRYGIFQYGFMHRCKHEIDNFDPDDNIDADLSYRVLLSSGPYASWLRHINRQRWNHHLQLRADFILLKGDFRHPENNFGSNFNDLLAEFTATTLNEIRINKVSKLYLRNWLNSMIFRNAFEYNIRSEIGVKFKQKASLMKIYIAFEHLFDDFMLHIPQSSDIIYFGFRGSNLIFW